MICRNMSSHLSPHQVIRIQGLYKGLYFIQLRTERFFSFLPLYASPIVAGLLALIYYHNAGPSVLSYCHNVCLNYCCNAGPPGHNYCPVLVHQLLIIIAMLVRQLLMTATTPVRQMLFTAGLLALNYCCNTACQFLIIVTTLVLITVATTGPPAHNYCHSAGSPAPATCQSASSELLLQCLFRSSYHNASS